MKNKYLGEYPVKIGSSDYTLVYDWKAIAELQSVHGNEILQKIGTIQGPDIMSKLLTCGLKKHHPHITEEFIFSQSPPIVPTMKAINAALTYAYFGPDEAKPANGAKDNKKKTL